MSRHSAAAHRLRRLPGWLLLLALLWWLLSGGERSGWWFGALLVPVCALVACLLVPPATPRMRPLGLLNFILFFLWQSLRAGIDVARRILHPRLRIAPGLVEVDLHLPAGAPRLLLAQVLSLLPGTLSVRLRDDRLLLHVLDREQPVVGEVRRAEHHIAALFGLPARGREA